MVTNAQRAAVLAVVNACLGAAVAFGAPLSEDQYAAVAVAANALLGLWVALTYKSSPKRIPDEPGA